MHNLSKDNCKIFKEGLMVRDLPSLARLALALLDFGPGLALQRRSARLRQLLCLLLPPHAYSYYRKDLHEGAMQDLIDGFHSINYKTTYDNLEEYVSVFKPLDLHGRYPQRGRR
jgi:hypothetical protein